MTEEVVACFSLLMRISSKTDHQFIICHFKIVSIDILSKFKMQSSAFKKFLLDNKKGVMLLK